MHHRDNTRLDAPEQATDEVGRLHRAGDGTMIDTTPKHLCDDSERIRAVDWATGVTFVHGTAYYMRSRLDADQTWCRSLHRRRHRERQLSLAARVQCAGATESSCQVAD
jgi:predicted metal-dependent phosphotriesterase family hydrolase